MDVINIEFEDGVQYVMINKDIENYLNLKFKNFQSIQ